MMKILSYLLFLVVILADDCKAEAQNLSDWPTYVETFQGFYNDLTVHNGYRRKLFDDNLLSIQQFNKEAADGLHTYFQGINQFTAMSKGEMRGKGYGHTGRQRSKREAEWKVLRDDQDYLIVEDPLLAQIRRNEDLVLEKTFDWADFGIISRVKYQNACSSCYAFSVLDTIEFHYRLQYGTSERLSAQMIIDCTIDKNEGCGGGYIYESFYFIQQVGGVALAVDYPYDGREGKCRKKGKKLQYRIKRFLRIPPEDEILMKKVLVSRGPIAVSIDSEHDSFKKYRQGIYDEEECSNDSLEHTGVLVGYGIEDGEEYWLVKNSWSEWWGVGGYIKVIMHKNRCGIASNAYFPIV